MLNRNITYKTMSGLATVLFIALIILIYFNSSEQKSLVASKEFPQTRPQIIENRSQVPEIIWKDSSGMRRSLSDLRGNVVYLNFWASWCQPCKEEIPFIAQIMSENLLSPLEVVLINLDNNTEDIDKAKLFLEEAAPQINSLFHQGNLFVNAFNTTAIPTHVFVDKKGNLALHFLGDILEHKEIFKSLLQHLLLEN